MLDGGSNEIDRDVVIATDREADWKDLHWRLRSLAQQRVALEAEEVSYLLEAEETRLFRRLGYSSMIEYMERELHWGPHAAKERLRVVRELGESAADRRAVPSRRVVLLGGARASRGSRTAETEEKFLAQARGKTARDVERMVAGLKRGDEPGADPDPARIKKRVVLEVSNRGPRARFAELGPRSMRSAVNGSPTMK